MLGKTIQNKLSGIPEKERQLNWILEDSRLVGQSDAVLNFIMHTPLGVGLVLLISDATELVQMWTQLPSNMVEVTWNGERASN